MSEEKPTTAKTPTLEAGQEIIDRCPVCHSKFGELVATNINHVCPNPNCGIKFCIMVFE